MNEAAYITYILLTAKSELSECASLFKIAQSHCDKEMFKEISVLLDQVEEIREKTISLVLSLESK